MNSNKSRTFNENQKFFCEECNLQTDYSAKGYNQHLKIVHGLTVDEYYRKHLADEGEGLCKVCRKPTTFIRISKGFTEFCSRECTQADPEGKKSRQATLISRYGTTVPMNIGGDKTKATNLKKYGTEHYFQSKDFRDKVAGKGSEIQAKGKAKRDQTNLERYGVVNPFASKDIKEKIRQTNIEKYGVENWQQSDHHKEKFKDQLIETPRNLIKDIPMYNEYQVVNIVNHKERIYTLKCPKNHETEVTYFHLRARSKNKINLCTHDECLPIERISSGQEKEVLEFVKTLYDGEIITNDRSVLSNGFEIDIHLVGLKLSVEYNGLVWHTEQFRPDPNYHLNKTLGCAEKGIRLIHIWEDDWLHKTDIVKSHIKNILNKNDRLISAKECEIREVDLETSEEFLNKNHIQEWCASKVNLGLYFKDELVSLMTFDNPNGNEFELLRFCNILNTTVSHGAVTLFSHFLKMWNPTKITVLCDRSWANGDAYRTLNFEEKGATKPNYCYVIDTERIGKWNFRKDVLVAQGEDPSKTEREIMESRGIFRIYDCGSLKYEWRRT